MNKEDIVKKGTVLIIRGLPGSGKSTYIKKIFPNAVICSADHYSVDFRGNYYFDKNKIGLNHQRSQEFFKTALKNFLPFIVVDNTNTEIWEFETYLQLAQEYDYQVFVIRLVVSPQIAIQRNVHKVPKNKIFEMHERMEKYPGEILLSNL